MQFYAVQSCKETKNNRVRVHEEQKKKWEDRKYWRYQIIEKTGQKKKRRKK